VAIPVGTHRSLRFFGTEGSIDAAIDVVRSDGILSLRDDCEWRTVEPTSGGGFTGWAATDRWVRQAAVNGISRLYIPLTKTPAWATAGGSDAAAPITTETTLHGRYRSFVLAFVQRYNTVSGTFWASGGGGVGLTAPELFFELWNEPWGSWAWRNVDGTSRTPSGGEYGGMCKSVMQHLIANGATQGYTMLWHTNPTQSPGTNHYHADMWAAVPDLANYCGGWSVHPYPELDGSNPTGDPDYDSSSGLTTASAMFASHMKYEFSKYRITRQVDLENGATIPIHLTEIGWPTAGTNGSTTPGGDPVRVVTEANQADNVNSLFSILRAARDVQGLVLYMAQDSAAYGAGGTTRENYFGLRKSDGSGKDALADLQAQLANPLLEPPGADPLRVTATLRGVTSGVSVGGASIALSWPARELGDLAVLVASPSSGYFTDVSVPGWTNAIAPDGGYTHPSVSSRWQVWTREVDADIVSGTTAAPTPAGVGAGNHRAALFVFGDVADVASPLTIVPNGFPAADPTLPAMMPPHAAALILYLVGNDQGGDVADGTYWAWSVDAAEVLDLTVSTGASGRTMGAATKAAPGTQQVTAPTVTNQTGLAVDNSVSLAIAIAGALSSTPPPDPPPVPDPPEAFVSKPGRRVRRRLYPIAWET
jgi:hypothetical protein